MSLISYQFLLFVAIGLLIYFVAPDRHKWKVLLAESLAYYLIICNKYILYMLVTIITTYVGTCQMDKTYSIMHDTVKANKSKIGFSFIIGILATIVRVTKRKWKRKPR